MIQSKRIDPHSTALPSSTFLPLLPSTGIASLLPPAASERTTSRGSSTRFWQPATAPSTLPSPSLVPPTPFSSLARTAFSSKAEFSRLGSRCLLCGTDEDEYGAEGNALLSASRLPKPRGARGKAEQTQRPLLSSSRRVLPPPHSVTVEREQGGCDSRTRRRSALCLAKSPGARSLPAKTTGDVGGLLPSGHNTLPWVANLSAGSFVKSNRRCPRWFSGQSRGWSRRRGRRSGGDANEWF